MWGGGQKPRPEIKAHDVGVFMWLNFRLHCMQLLLLLLIASNRPKGTDTVCQVISNGEEMFADIFNRLQHVVVNVL